MVHRGCRMQEQDGLQLRSKVRLPVESGELTKTKNGKGEFTPRRSRIRAEELDKFEHTRQSMKLGGEDGHGGGGACGGMKKECSRGVGEDRSREAGP